MHKPKVNPEARNTAVALKAIAEQIKIDDTVDELTEKLTAEWGKHPGNSFIRGIALYLLITKRVKVIDQAVQADMLVEFSRLMKEPVQH